MAENDIQESSQDTAPPPSRSVNNVVHADAKNRSAHIEQPSTRPSTKRIRDLAQNCSELIRICSELQQPSESENLEILCFGPKKALPCAGSFRKLSIQKRGRVALHGMVKERFSSEIPRGTQGSSVNRCFFGNQFWTILNIPGISEHFWNLLERKIWEYQHVAWIRGDALSDSQSAARSQGRGIRLGVQQFLGLGFSEIWWSRSLKLN